MAIKIENIRPRDTVTVEGVVAKIDGDIVTLVTGDSPNKWQFSIPVDYIASHTPKPREFKPGDMVTWGHGAVALEFIAVRDGYAIMWEKPTQTVWREVLSEIRHIDEEGK